MRRQQVLEKRPDEPQTAEKDNFRYNGNGRLECTSCHEEAKKFTDNNGLIKHYCQGCQGPPD